jgi:transcriptional regulator of heat shock response
VIYGKIEVSWYDGIISVIWPTRVDYKKNVSVLKNFFRLYNKKIK